MNGFFDGNLFYEAQDTRKAANVLETEATLNHGACLDDDMGVGDEHRPARLERVPTFRRSFVRGIGRIEQRIEPARVGKHFHAVATIYDGRTESANSSP